MMLEKAVEKTVLPQGHLIILNDLHQQREFSSLNGIAGVANLHSILNTSHHSHCIQRFKVRLSNTA